MSALPLPILMLVTDRALAGSSTALVAAVDAALAGGVNAVQVREKELRDHELLPLARDLRAITAGRALLLINGPPALALAVSADGVHLPEDGLPVAAVRRATRGRLLVGRSVHSVEAARAAEAEGADYLILGTIFPSRSHPGGATGGPALAGAVAHAVRVPVIGIGGIDTSNLGTVITAGAAGVAVISAILGQPDPRAAAAMLRAALDAAWQERTTAQREQEREHAPR